MNPASATKLFKHRLALYNKSYNAIIQTVPHFDTTTTTSSDLPSTCLTGVPVAVKEVIDVAGLPTTLCDPSLQKGFASALYSRPKSPAQEATVVTRLRQAGALIVGKPTSPPKDWTCNAPTNSTAPPTIHGTRCARPAVRPAGLARRWRRAWCPWRWAPIWGAV